MRGRVAELTATADPLERGLVPKILACTPHDPAASTQGLVLDGDRFFESTGLRGESTLRELDPETGDVLRRVDLDGSLFGEGLAAVGECLIQLTWRSGIAIAYDRDTFAEIGQVTYEGEGWGLSYDGARLVMSDGSSTLMFRDPATLAVIGSIPVRLDGSPIGRLNDLECVQESLWANVWRTDLIVRIDRATGAVTGVVDASNIADNHRGEGVLNGIAWNPETGTWLLTGKKWSSMYEVEFVPGPSPVDP